MLKKGKFQDSLSSRPAIAQKAERITANSVADDTEGLTNGRIKRRDAPGSIGSLPSGSFGAIPVPAGNNGRITLGTGGLAPPPPPPYQDSQIPFKPDRNTRLKASGKVTPNDATQTRKQVAGSSNPQASY